MSALKTWWAALNGRERRLVTIMLGLAGAIFLWLGVWRPVRSGIEDGRTRYAAAVDLNGSVRAKLALLKTLPAAVGGTGGPLDQLVGQSAGEAGLTLDRSAPQDEGRLAITISSARAGALLGWLSGLEARGVSIETLTITPGTTPGIVVVQAVLRGGR